MKNYNKTTSTFNGNGKRIERGLPTLILPKFGNDVAKKHFIKNTGLKLEEKWSSYIAKPKSYKQLYKVFLTYNFTTTYFDNASFGNTLHLKFKEPRQ
jgi:hypothetical protein